MHRPSPLRLFGLFARTALRRFSNRFLFAWQRKAEAKRKKRNLPEPDRTATIHRQQRFRAGNVLVVLFAAYLLFTIGLMMNGSFLQTVRGVREIEWPDPSPAASYSEDAGTAQGLPNSQTPLNTRGYTRVRGSRVLTGMVDSLHTSTEKAIGLMLLIAGVGTLCFNIGILSRQISKPEPSLAWLFEFPVPRPVLFASRMGENLFDGFSLPLLSMLPGMWAFHSGLSFWASVGWGLAFGTLITLSVSSLRMAVEVVLLQKCRRRRRGTIGGICGAAGALLMVIVLYGGNTPSLVRTLLAAAEWLPSWVYHNPFSAGWGDSIAFSFASWAPAAAVTAAMCAGSVLLCSHLTKYGLEPGLDTVRGSRESGKTPNRMFSGLVGKELLMLVRQRTVMVQVILAPVIMVLMMYFQSSGRLAENILRSDGALASAIYGVCAYMVLIASQVAMNMELRTLWLLLSLPRPLADSLRMKSRIWGLAAAALALVLAIGAMLVHRDLAGGLFYRLPFLLIFIALIADLSVGIRTMGSSIVSESSVHFRQWAAWLPLALSAAAGQAVFAGDVWVLCVQLVLLGALDVSVWQKLNAELPWLTEPAEDPPPRLYLMHGQLAAYGYFILQGLGLLLAVSLKIPPAGAVPVASALAAGVVAALTFWLLVRRKVRILPEAKARKGPSFAFAALGLLVAAGAGFLWLSLLQTSSWGSKMLEQSRMAVSFTDDPANWIGFICLAVIVAPVCEEFIFRGLIFQGLRRTGSAAWAMVWSSLFFTAVHPPVSSVAVFSVAMVNAWIMERTGRLLPCMLVHAGYNAFMIWLQTRG